MKKLIPNSDDALSVQLRSTMSGVVFDDAIAFVCGVKSRFEALEPERFQKFLLLLNDYRYKGRMSMADLLERMNEVLAGHDDLILGFRKFLPPSVELEDEQPPLKPVGFQDALIFENKIKDRDSELYKSFMGILETYKGKNKTSSELYSEGVEILQGHPDLLDEFKKFFPNTP